MLFLLSLLVFMYLNDIRGGISSKILNASFFIAYL